MDFGVSNQTCHQVHQDGGRSEMICKGEGKRPEVGVHSKLCNRFLNEEV